MVGADLTLTETLKNIIQSLQLRFLFPALFFMLIQWFFFPFIPEAIDIDPTDKWILFITVTVIFSYLLNAFNGLIIRLAEGYELRSNILFNLLYKLEKNEFENKINEIKNVINKKDELNNEIVELDNEEEIKSLEEEVCFLENKHDRLDTYLKFRFPDNKHDIQPTSIGNIIYSFEHYPYERYNIDSVNLWPHMVPILENKNYLKWVMNEKSTFDFLVNCAIISLFVIFESIIAFGYFSDVKYIFFCFFLIILFLLFYKGASAVATDWGVWVRAAYDLYRYDLRKALNLPTKKSEYLEEEKKIWENISKVILLKTNISEVKYEYINETKKQEGVS